MPITTCPYCLARSTMIFVADSGQVPSTHVLEAAFTCTGCKRMLIGRSMAPLDQNHWVNENDPAAIGAGFEFVPEDGITWEPASPLGKEFPDVPPQIAAPASEAFASHSIGAYRAAILMARAVIEAIAKEKSVTEGGLFSKIEQLGKLSILRPATVAVAQEVRAFGNEMAHGDFVVLTVTEKESTAILEFLEVVLLDAYQIHAKLSRHASARSKPS